MSIVCLLPVRNGAETLSEWLDEAGTFADAVVALDDGSTDGTGAILASHPLVEAVIANEPRAGYLGWHDGRNRNRLLKAALDLDAEWIFSLDADERLDPTDAAGLRRFVATEALPGCAYGFQLYRMHDCDTYDPDYEWVYRLFACRPDHRFLNRRLDLVPVPTAVGSERWVTTTLRIKHFGDGDEASRRRRVAKFREADPEGGFREYYEHLRPIAPGPFPAWRPRPPDAPLLLDAVEPQVRSSPRPHVVCLLPARDCADLLPGWFESIARVADAVVALDDGSIDATAEILRAHPLVVTLLTSPPRPDFRGWDDGTNRNRLLAAAAALSPTWIISVDADERIPLDDAAALRRFLHEGAEPGLGYALASYRMIGDEDHYDRLDYDAYRLFAFEPGHVFPPDRLHAPPIPTAIPPDRWRQTTIRMKHLVSLTDEARRARHEKFRQADPDCVWEPDYAYTIQSPGEVKPWMPRPLDLPVLVHPDPSPGRPDELDLDGPVLTVVVAVEPGEEYDAVTMLGAVAPCDQRVELLAATRDGYAAGVLRRHVPEVRVMTVGPEATEAGLRNHVLAVARGDYIAFFGVADRLTAQGLTELIDAHEAGHGVVRVPVAESSQAPAAWAELLLADAQPDSTYASFAREPLYVLGGFDDHAPDGLDAAAARALMGLGLTTTATSSIVCHRGSTRSLPELLRDRYHAARWGQPLPARVGTVDAWREAHVVVAGLVAAGGAASWLGAVRRRVGRDASR